MSLSDAWHLGTNVRSAYKHEPKMTIVGLTALLKDALDYLEMNKSFRHEGDYIDAVTYLIEQFPTMKLEEWKVITKRLKAGYYGKLYERLKLPELVEIFKQHEGERGDMIENNYNRQKVVYKQEAAQKAKQEPLTKEQIKKWQEFKDKLNLPESDVDDKGRWKFIVHPNSTIDD